VTDDEIPVLNAIREQLVAAIGARAVRRRLPVWPLVGVAVAAVVAVAVLVAGRPGHQAGQVVASNPATTVTGSNGGAPSVTTTTGAQTAAPSPKPVDGRLHRPYVPAEYKVGSASMDSWRMDPAPPDVKPRLSQAQVLALLGRSAPGDHTAQPHTTTTVRFGLFTGNGPNPSGPPPDHLLTGSHPIGPLPAWIILVDGIELVPSGGGFSPGGSVVPVTPVRGYALTVVSDQDGHDLTGSYEVGGASAASTGIE